MAPGNMVCNYLDPLLQKKNIPFDARVASLWTQKEDQWFSGAGPDMSNALKFKLSIQIYNSPDTCQLLNIYK